MATILNTGFEDGADGLADNWVQTQVAGAVRIMGFTATPNDLPQEGFEVGFSNNEDYFFEFVLLPSATAVFEAMTNLEEYEDYEEEWSNNQSYLFEFVSSVLSAADLDTVEADPDLGNADRFENGWTNNVYDITLGSVSTADLDPTTVGTADTMENDWRNSTYDLTLGTTSTGDFDGTNAEAYEDFEEVKLEQPVTGITPGTDLITIEVGQNLVDGTRVQFYVENGQMPTGLNVGIKYYVVSSASNTFKVATSSGGAAVDIADTGSGELFIVPDKSIYWVNSMVSI